MTSTTVNNHVDSLFVHDTQFQRFGAALFIGSAVTVGLFYIMYLAVHNEAIDLPPQKPLITIDLVKKIKEPDPAEQPPRVVPPPVVAPPPPIPVPTAFDGPTVGSEIEFRPPPTNDGVNIQQGAVDGSHAPIFTVAPNYPSRAASRGIEGWVIMQFTIDKLGRVIDPVVIDAQPQGFFEREALRAVKRYKYRPRVVNGQAVEVRGVQQRITFELNKV